MKRNDSHDEPSEQSANQRSGSTSRRGFLKATAATAATAGIGSGAIGSAAAAGIPTPWLHRDGNLIRDPEDNKVILRGVNIVDPYRAARDAPYYKRRAETLVEMATDQSNGWHSHVIRIPMQPNDIAREGAGSVEPGAFTQEQLDSYLSDYVDPAVDKCEEVGAYCILDYHRHWPDGPGWDDPDLSDEVHMFWETVAPRYAERSHVLYEVFNEPTEPYAGHDVYDGGPDVTDPESEDTWLNWRETAQPWVDTIREHAPRNLVLIGSPRWSQWTYWAPDHEFDGDNLAYTGHVYTQDNLRPLSTYFGEPSEEVPVFMSEFGWGGSEPQLQGDAETYAPQFAELFDEYDLHWQAWSFDFDWEPGMLNRDYEVANDWGRWVKDRLQEFEDQDVPQTDDGGSTPGGGSDTTAPTAPSNLAVAETTSTTVTVAWDAASDSGGSELARYEVSAGTSAVTVQAGTTEATLDGLSPATEYDVSVVAVDGAGNESDAATVAATTDQSSDAGSTVDVLLSESAIDAGGETTATVSLAEAPDGLSGFDLTVSVADTSVATIQSASTGDAVSAVGDEPQPSSDGSSVTLSGADLSESVESGATNVVLATVTLAGREAGQTEVTVDVGSLQNNAGSEVPVETGRAPLSVADMQAILDEMPTDPDGDGLYEDLNGNGEVDYQDVVTYFNNMDEPAMTNNVAAYDYNGNGEIDFADLVELFGQVE
ncbi:cellulase family glycosylhydrolase [Halomicrobium salinisoli]|uniref:cellulase family glycosylhydrolase n=1 Tax=Halomicrobium salinisoli TaxID=2878391 RepID=UPI001CEFFE25|nr:cellulase family glycosylhydrolase [Halomicrobium salinisoli]